jgi:hypothetical protein
MIGLLPRATLRPMGAKCHARVKRNVYWFVAVELPLSGSSGALSE